MTAVPPAELNGTPYPGSNPFRRPSSAHSQSGAFPVKLIAVFQTSGWPVCQSEADLKVGKLSDSESNQEVRSPAERIRTTDQEESNPRLCAWVWRALLSLQRARDECGSDAE